MNKGYFLVKPSSFSRIGEINIDGEYEYVQCEDFNVTDPKENYLIFEVRYEENDGVRYYYEVCKELITRARFNLNIENRRKRKSSEEVLTAVLTSENIGLYSKVLPLESIEVKSSRVSGLIKHFIDNPEEKEQYCHWLKKMIEEANSYQKEYDDTIDGPSRRLRNQMRSAYRNTIVK